MDVKQLYPESPEHILGLTSNYLLAFKQAIHHEGGPQPHRHGLTYALDGPKNALQGGKVFAQIRKSKFKLPVMASHPIIMVAAGIGIAPFRGFLQERARLLSMGREVGRMLLFFGCRRSDEDFLYKEELGEMVRLFDGKLDIVTAYSGAQLQRFMCRIGWKSVGCKWQKCCKRMRVSMSVAPRVWPGMFRSE